MEKKKPVTSKANMASQRKTARKGQDMRPTSRKWRQIMGERMPLTATNEFQMSASWMPPPVSDRKPTIAFVANMTAGPTGESTSPISMLISSACTIALPTLAHPESRRAIRRARMVFSFCSFVSPMSALA